MSTVNKKKKTNFGVPPDSPTLTQIFIPFRSSMIKIDGCAPRGRHDRFIPAVSCVSQTLPAADQEEKQKEKKRPWSLGQATTRGRAAGEVDPVKWTVKQRTKIPGIFWNTSVGDFFFFHFCHFSKFQDNFGVKGCYIVLRD